MVLVVTHNFAKVKLRVRFSLPAPLKPDLYPYSGSADAKTGWAALTGFADFLTQKNQHQFGKLGRVRFIAAVLKTAGSKGSVSSNLTVSAITRLCPLCSSHSTKLAHTAEFFTNQLYYITTACYKRMCILSTLLVIMAVM